MRLSEEERNMREGLRSQTQKRAIAFMNEVEAERQAAAAKGDRETAFWLQEQIKALAEASTAADAALAAKAPISNAQEQREMRQRLTEYLKR